ncbi:MAG: lgrE5 [Cyanobacteria bacterium RYN_339]|nr:lgrE5 [Cyanobacteria bacterium RYN_339]
MSCLVPFPARPGLPRLYCVPHAGGGASIYRPWADGLVAACAVVGVQPPGREQRLREEPPGAIGVLADEVAAAIDLADDGPFALFGHSLGALIAYEVARRLEALGRPPIRLYVSGCRAPHLERAGAPVDDAELLARVQTLGGMPAQLLANPDVLAIYLPTLKADYRLALGYVRAPGPPLACPITALGGIADEAVPRPDLTAWRASTTGAFEAIIFPGDHFYLAERRAEVLALVAGRL